MILTVTHFNLLCAMQVEVPIALKGKIALVPGKVQYFRDEELQEYTVTSVTVDSHQSHRIRLKISLKRHTTLYWLETFIPTMFLIGAAQLTLFISETHFEATVMVALTSALVM